MKLSTATCLSDINAEDWNALVDDNNLFVQYDFLSALEKHDCLAPWGWQPAYQLVHDDAGQLIGATPSYLKTNSYGEFVFDWAWADAYQRHGMEYYPKLITAVPFTPAKGPRLLTKNNDAASTIKTLLVRGATTMVENENLSSAHWLFCEQNDIDILRNENMLLRFDHQFHWSNQNYENFDHFLSQLSSKKRKNIRRERRKVTEANISVNIKSGNELIDQDQAIEWPSTSTRFFSYSMRFSG